MIDSVTLKILPAIPPKEIYSKTELFSGYQVKGRVRNLTLTSNEEYSILKGSLPKYMNDSNVHPLSFLEIPSTINKLENELQSEIGTAQILNLEWSSTIPTDYPPKTYYSMLGETWPFERVTFKNSLYFNSSKNKVIFYDKGREARCNGNLLRYELRFPKVKSLGLTLQRLTCADTYNQLTKSWLDVYFSINKIRKPMPQEVKTKKDLNRYLESVGIETLGGKDQVLLIIDNLHRQGRINDYNKSRMKSDLTNFINNISQESDLEGELNSKIQMIADQNLIKVTPSSLITASKQ